MLSKEVKNQILKKQEILKTAQNQLKKEFVGIDQVIDQVIASCSSWYLMPQLQDKPVIVNLWGLTGVGKSSLINRLVELIGMGQKYYRFDLGNKKNSDWSIDNKLSEIYENENGFPIVLAFDEFQHIKSIDEIGRELENQEHRVIWDILDSGKYMTTRYKHYANELYELIGKLEHALANNVKVEEGKVISNKKYFIKNIDEKYHHPSIKKSIKSEIPFVHDDNLDYLFQMGKEHYLSIFEIRSKLNQLNGYQTVDFLKQMFSIVLSPKIVDCSKSIIFVMGNLDKAYNMSYDFNPDMDADEFHKQSLKINITHIKNALQFRFRNEQIARLGNTHIIYPAFNSKSFREIISLELNKIISHINKEYQINLNIDKSIHKVIYEEGVFPTQGTRPVFTTIYQMVKSKLGNILTKIYSKNLVVQSISIRRENNDMMIDYLNNNNVIYQFKEPLPLSLERLRKPKKDDLQSIVAVHECGHAIISIALLKTVPKIVFSKTVDVNSSGFNYIDYDWKYISKKEILARVAVFLGGIVAEKIIFGDENITCGSESDIYEATRFTACMLKNSGMGSLYANYSSVDFRTDGYLHDANHDINSQVKIIIENAQKLAVKTLNRQKTLLVHLSDYLSENRYIKKEKIKEFILQYAVDFNTEDLIENGNNLFYRNQLKKQVTQSINTKNSQKTLNGFSLNKNINDI
jgi:hypothetical protein